MATKKPIEENNVPASAKVAPGGDYVDRLVRNEKTVRCEAVLDATRKVVCQSGLGVFDFEFHNGNKIQRLKVSDDAAWIIGEMISSMHPHILGSNNPLWHQVQSLRQGDTIPNTKVRDGGGAA